MNLIFVRDLAEKAELFGQGTNECIFNSFKILEFDFHLGFWLIIAQKPDQCYGINHTG